MLQTLVNGSALGAGAPAVAAPFRAGLQVFGATNLYLACLIDYSPWRLHKAGSWGPYFLALLVAGVAGGTLIPRMAALANTALVFSYLHALDRLSHFFCRDGPSFGGMLAVSTFLMAGAGLAHLRPEAVAALAGAVSS